MAGKNILLVWPKTDKGFYNFSPLNEIFGQKGQFYPLSLITVAGAMGPDWNYTIIDEEVEDVRDTHEQWADFIFISSNILQRKSAERLVGYFKSFNKPIVIGGPLLPTLDHVFENDNVSKVIGEIESLCDNSEKTIARQLADDMRKGILRKIYRASGHPDLREISPPRYDLLSGGSYFNVSLQTSRGCHNNCEFCQMVALYGRHRRKSIDQVLHELNLLHASGEGKTVYIVDDNFMGNINQEKNRAEFIALLEAIRDWQKERDFPFDFFSQCSLEIADHDDIVELMAAIGVNIMFLGIETLNTKALASVRKNQNLEKDQVAKVRKLQRYGMGIIAGLILGFDEDDEEAVDGQIRFIRESNIPLSGMSVLQAPLGTRLYKRLFEAGRISRDKDAITKSFRTNVILRQHPKTFYSGYLKFIKTVYAPVEYFNRCFRWIDGWNDAYVLSGKKGSIPANLYFIRIVRSIVIQGLFSGYRFQYWTYMLRAIWKYHGNINRLALAFYLAYFYRVVHDISQKVELFTRTLPDEIIREWFRC